MLKQNYPNPFNPSTTIEFAIPVSGKVELKVFDLLGKQVAILLNKEMSSGNYKINFSAGSNLSSGIYVYQLKTDNFTKSKKLMLLK